MKSQQNLDDILALLFSICLLRKLDKFLQYFSQLLLAASLYLSEITTINNNLVSFLYAWNMIKKILGSLQNVLSFHYK